MDEFGFIESLLAPLASDAKGALGLKDDAAILSVPEGQELVITKDALSEGVHFIGDEPPELIARKLLQVNLSDLAAMGAEPLGYFLALMLPSSVDESWLTSFAQGLRTAQETYGITLMGGDTTRINGPLALSVTALGIVPKGGALLRSGAKVGDEIYVSGTLGDAALGLKIAKGEIAEDDFLLGRYRLPEPRLELGKALRGIASACIDISDGLMQDLGHICTCSGVGAELDWHSIPLSSQARLHLAKKEDRYEAVLAGGDDYELLFTVPPAQAGRLTGLPVTRIGCIINGKGVRALDGQQEIILPRHGYRHF